jgi:Domain of unknown function (DUF4440)
MNESFRMSMAGFFRELETLRIRALVARDMDQLWRLHAEEYQLITPSGRSFLRERYLREIESGSLRYRRWEPGPIGVRVSERMAIVRYQALLELGSGNDPGTPFRCWHTDSYELKGDIWQAVWSQATPIREPD